MLTDFGKLQMVLILIPWAYMLGHWGLLFIRREMRRDAR